MKTKNNPFYGALIISAAFAASVATIHAADFTWGGGSLNWTDTSATGWSGGPPTASDTATINSGRVEVTADIDTAPISIGAGGQLYINYASATIANNITLNGISTGGTIISGDLPNGNVTTLTGQITLNATSNIASWWNDKSLEISGKITGSGGLILDRATTISWGGTPGGRLIISGSNNDYTGGTTINGLASGPDWMYPKAMLVLGANNALPSGSPLALNDADLHLNGYSQTLSEITSTGVSSIRGGSETAGSLIWNVGTSHTFGGNFGGGALNENNFSVTKTGVGTLSLTGTSSSHTGGTTVSEGSLSLGNGTSSVNLSDSATLTIAAGTTVNLNYTGTDYVSNLVIDNAMVPPGTYDGTILTPLPYRNFFTGTGSISVLPPLVGHIWGGGNLQWEDTTSLGWTNGTVPTATDTANIPAGRVEITQAIELSPINIRSGGQFWINYNGAIIDNDFSLNGITPGGMIVAGDLAGGNVSTLNGQITLNFTSNLASWWSDKTLEITSKITGNGGLVLDRATTTSWFDPAGGRFLISGSTNDYLGGTTVNGRAAGNHGDAPAQSRVVLGADNALPAGSTLALNTGALYLNGYSQTLSTITSTGVSQIRGGSSTAGSLTWDVATSNSFAGTLGGPGTDENNFSLTKSGAGTLTLTAQNTFTGDTTANAGGLAIPSGGGLRFLPELDGITNSVTGSSSASLNYLGTVDLDLSVADATVGNTWTLVNLATFSGPAPTFNPDNVTSTLGAFTEASPGVWQLTASGVKWVFTESTATLACATASGFDLWASSQVPPVTGGPTGDSNNNGVANLVEYALIDGGERGSFDTATRTVSFTKRAEAVTNGDVTYTIEESDDLGITDEWEAVISTTVEDTISYTLPAPSPGQPKIFTRLKVSQNQ